MSNKNMKGWSTSTAIREMQIKTTMKFHCTANKMAKQKLVTATKVDKNAVTDYSYIVGGDVQ